MMDTTKPPGITIAQIYAEHVEFSHRDDALNLPHETRVPAGEIEMEVGIFTSKDSPNSAALRLTVRSKAVPDALYRFRIQLIGVVMATPGQENLPPVEYVTTHGATMLFPFARELLANLTMRGKFGPIWLTPTNFLAAAQQDAERKRLVAAAD